MAHPKKGALHQVLVPMVDATDFASVESAITASDFNSGATVKFYGWNTGTSAATTSGTVSKTASLVRSGVFRITLKTTENNYDMMMLRVNKTGAAEQILTWSNVDNDDSDLLSALTVIQSMASDAASAAAQGNSRVLLVQSRLSDLDSRLVSDISDIKSALSDAHSDLASKIAGITASVSASDISDIASAVWAHTVGTRVDSRVLLLLSNVSDVQSAIAAGVALDASTMSDLRSAIAAGPAATVTASDISDIASAVRAILVSDLSDLLSRTTQINSRVVLIQSTVSDTYSSLSDALSAPMSASDLSDIASAVWANSIGARVDSRVLLIQSRVSDVNSALAAGVALDASTLSDLRSAIAAGPAGALTVSDISDIASRVQAVLASDLSDLLSRTTQINSRVALVQSNVSDVESQVDAGVALDASTLSDLRSAIAAATLDASSISDIASAVWAVARVEPTGAVSPTGTMKTGVEWLVAMHRNKITQNSAVQSLRNDADSADIASAAVSDDGTTFTRGEWG